MKKIFKSCILIVILGVINLLCISCNNLEEKNVSKNILGQEPIFSDFEGYREEDPSIIENSEGVRYVYYTTNEKKYDKLSEPNPITSIAVRKGQLENGEWKYSEKKIVLSPETGSWNSAGVSDASVIRGSFEYAGEKYSYLMAYAGTNSNSNLNPNYQIGFALAKEPDEPFISVSQMPYITFNPTHGGANAFGAGNPSLVSYDKAGKVRMFYTYADAKLMATRIMELDMGSITDNDIQNKLLDKGYVELNYGIILDTSKALFNVSVAYDTAEQKFYLIRDMFTDSPCLDIMYATKDWFYKPTLSTSIPVSVKNVGLDEIYDETKETEWENIYSGAIITDEYGYISGKNIEIAYTVNIATNSDDLSYLYKSVICTMKMDI